MVSTTQIYFDYFLTPLNIQIILLECHVENTAINKCTEL